MKDILVLIASIILGVCLAVMVLGFEKSAEDVTKKANNQLNSIITQLDSTTYPAVKK